MRLLLSVVDVSEARTAAGAGADIIDVKDPAAGALGRPAPGVVRAIRAAIPLALPVSVAVGDGPWVPREAAAAARDGADEGALFVKVGLRETPAAAALDTLRAVRAALPDGTRLIAAGFADAARAGSPPPADLPWLAQAAGAHGCLIDTAVKDGRGLLDWLPAAALVAFVTACRQRGLLSALAGSLTPADLQRVAAIAPDIVGVRGAACDGDRIHGRISGRLVARLGRALAAGAGACG